MVKKSNKTIKKPTDVIKIWCDRRDTKKWFHFDPDSNVETELVGLDEKSTTQEVLVKLQEMKLRRVK